jgi:argininosuccinate synthase
MRHPLEAFKDSFCVVDRQSAYGMYDRGLATYEDGDSFDHSAAEGFVKIWGLPVETAAAKKATSSTKRAPTGAGRRS